jgi:hypothetical protein
MPWYQLRFVHALNARSLKSQLSMNYVGAAEMQQIA